MVGYASDSLYLINQISIIKENLLKIGTSCLLTGSTMITLLLVYLLELGALVNIISDILAEDCKFSLMKAQI
jgi:hypothetical protein